MIAPATAAAITAHSGTVPRKAATPPRMTAISPGKTKPTNAEASSAGKANTSARTSQPGSDRMRSVILAARPRVTTGSARPERSQPPRDRGGLRQDLFHPVHHGHPQPLPGRRRHHAVLRRRIHRAFVLITHLDRRTPAREPLQPLLALLQPSLRLDLEGLVWGRRQRRHWGAGGNPWGGHRDRVSVLVWEWR